MANLSLGTMFETYIDDQVKGGLYNNRSEVVRDALRKQMDYDNKLAALRGDIDEGMQSIHDGKYSTATADDIKKQALKRKKKGE